MFVRVEFDKKYLGDEPVKPEFLSPHVELQGFGAFKRVCRTCCDPGDCVMGQSRNQESGRPPCPLSEVRNDRG